MKKYSKYTKEIVEEIVKKHDNQKDCIIELFGKSKPNNYNQFYNLLKRFDIKTDHFLSQGELLKRSIERKGGWERITNGEIFVENYKGGLTGNNIKKRLYDNNLKQPICELCGQDENWKTGKMSMILDHINGNNEDNRLENLRIVCPNCNATLPTHTGKNKKLKNE